MYGENAMAAVGGTRDFANLRFKKNTAEIREATAKRVALLQSEIRSAELRIGEICKRREVSPSEVLGQNAHETVEKIGAYSTSNADRYQGKTAMEKFNADMAQLRSESWGIEHARTTITMLTRVHNNLEPGCLFDLDYHELTTLGF